MENVSVSIREASYPIGWLVTPALATLVLRAPRPIRREVAARYARLLSGATIARMARGIPSRGWSPAMVAFSEIAPCIGWTIYAEASTPAAANKMLSIALETRAESVSEVS